MTLTHAPGAAPGDDGVYSGRGRNLAPRVPRTACCTRSDPMEGAAVGHPRDWPRASPCLPPPDQTPVRGCVAAEGHSAQGGSELKTKDPGSDSNSPQNPWFPCSPGQGRLGIPPGAPRACRLPACPLPRPNSQALGEWGGGVY